MLRRNVVVIVMMVEALGRKELLQFGGLDLDCGSCFMIPMQYRERINKNSFFRYLCYIERLKTSERLHISMA